MARPWQTIQFQPAIDLLALDSISCLILGLGTWFFICWLWPRGATQGEEAKCLEELRHVQNRILWYEQGIPPGFPGLERSMEQIKARFRSCESQIVLCQTVTCDSFWKASGPDIRKELSHIDDDIYKLAAEIVVALDYARWMDERSGSAIHDDA
ncbi:hypothetical protein BJ322DRAFT_288596 [Thelephora terrestris]|uniref:Uncharacterized protein n=1 Tax=Thelephora terrestris TaxID=56493 RepID=A0A9P6H7U2_9AGAM|nr:hypothetical protein BJ322DRAFT_288596 [Thelephora terrestris]